MSLEKRDKKPSKELVLLLRQSAKTLVKFAEVWKKVQEKGYEEGFDEKELREMVRPYLKQRLTTGQIKYLFDSEYYKEKTKMQHTRSKYDIFTQVEGLSYNGSIHLLIEFFEQLEKSGKMKDKKFEFLLRPSTEGIPPEKLPEMIKEWNETSRPATQNDIENIKSASPALRFNEKAMREFLDKKD